MRCEECGVSVAPFDMNEHRSKHVRWINIRLARTLGKCRRTVAGHTAKWAADRFRIPKRKRAVP